MSSGVATADGSGNLLLYSPNMNAAFLRGSGVFTGTSTIQDSTWSQTFAINTPISPATIDFLSGSCAGSVSADGLTYYQPSVIGTGAPSNRNWYYTGQDDSISSIQSSYVHYFGTPPAANNGYGFNAFGLDNTKFAINQDFKSLYIQPDSTGNKIRTGTAYSIPSVSSGAQPNRQVYISLSQPTSQTITFDKAYVNPPLIFITATSGPIAFNYMVRDGNGMYIGASIVAASSFSTPNTYSGTGAYTANTYTFSYFLVSEEYPVYVPQAPWGMRVFNGSGETVFNSSYFVPSFNYLTVAAPYLSFSYSSAYGINNSSSFTTTGSLGICINNLNSFTGVASYTGYSITYQGGGTWCSGPRNICGTYLNISGSSVSVYAYGTAATQFSTNLVFTTYYTQNYAGRSYQYTLSPSASLNLIYATYA